MIFEVDPLRRLGTVLHMQHGRTLSSRQEAGFTYLWTLALLAIGSISLMVVGPMWAHEVQRERERDLLRVGILYVQAIESYYRVSLGTKSLPMSLDQLVLDQRFVGTIRHLRRIYNDPTNPSQPFTVLRDGSGGIIGVVRMSADDQDAESFGHKIPRRVGFQPAPSPT